MQAGGAEALRRDGEAQQVAVIEDELAIARVVRGFAVVNGRELRIGAQRAGDASRQRGARRGIAAVDRDRISRDTTPSRNWSTSTRCPALGALGRNADRSAVKCARPIATPHAMSASSHTSTARCRSACRRRATGDAGAGAFVHQFGFAGTGCSRITERSPSACRIATLRNTSRVPSSVIVLTTFSIRESSGVSVSVQSSPRPASATLYTCSSAKRLPASVARMLSMNAPSSG